MSRRAPKHVINSAFYEGLDEVFDEFGAIRPITTEQAEEIIADVVAHPEKAPAPEVSVQLFEENRALAFHIVHKKLKHESGKIFDIEDAQQVALLALAKASREFCPDRGVKFSSFAWRCISNAIDTNLRKELTMRGREINSIDQPRDQEDSHSETRGEILTYTEAGGEVTFETAEDSLVSKESREALMEAIAALEPREQQVISLKLEELSLEEIGRAIDPPVTAARVCQIYKSAFAHLKAALSQRVEEGTFSRL